MAEHGDERDCGGYTRRYYDEQWDLIIAGDGENYWRDKENHITYECDSSFMGILRDDMIGDEVDMFNDEDEDGIWDDDEEDNGNEEESKGDDDDEEKDNSDNDDE